jgi:hypothetical protein
VKTEESAKQMIGISALCYFFCVLDSNLEFLNSCLETRPTHSTSHLPIVIEFPTVWESLSLRKAECWQKRQLEYRMMAFIYLFMFLLCWVEVHCGIYKGSYNISYLNSALYHSSLSLPHWDPLMRQFMQIDSL